LAPVSLKELPPRQHAEEEESCMDGEKSEVQSWMNEDVLGQEPPVDRPLEQENPAEIEGTL